MLGMWATPCLLPTGGKTAGSVDLRAQVQTASATAKGTPPPVCRMCVRAPCLWGAAGFSAVAFPVGPVGPVGPFGVESVREGRPYG